MMTTKFNRSRIQGHFDNTLYAVAACHLLYLLKLHLYAMSRVMPHEVCKPMINRGKAFFFLGIIRKVQQIRNDAFPTLGFGRMSEISRKTERQLARPQQETNVHQYRFFAVFLAAAPVIR